MHVTIYTRENSVCTLSTRICSLPPSIFLILHTLVLLPKWSSDVWPGPRGSWEELTVALGTGIRTVTLVPDLCKMFNSLTLFTCKKSDSRFTGDLAFKTHTHPQCSEE